MLQACMSSNLLLIQKPFTGTALPCEELTYILQEPMGWYILTFQHHQVILKPK